LIAGAAAPESLRRLHGRDGITVVSPMEDRAAQLRQARIAVVPLRAGSGVSNKVLEAAEASCAIAGTPIAYRGIDIAPDMIEAARHCWKQTPRVEFVVGAECGSKADYSVASGVFNVRLGWPVAAWEAYVQSILSDLHRSSRIGFSVNFMSPLDDPVSGENLYRVRPDRWAGFCSDGLGCKVERISGYGLPEFTLLVRIG